MKIVKKSLDELGYVRRGKSKHRPRDSAHLYNGTYPFIQTSDVKNASLFIKNYTQTYSEAGLAQSKLWKSGTLCITIAANIADTAILSFDACFPDSIIGFIPDQDKSDGRYIKYLFDTVLQKHYKKFSQGATQDNLSQKKLLSLKLPVINDVNEQRKIADKISNYDKLIDINLKRILLLEEAAQLLYREWFVYFRFPGHQQVKFVDGIPEGWEDSTVKDCISFISRGPSLDYITEDEEEGIPVLNQRCIRKGEINLDSVEYAKELSIKQKDLYLKKYDILINSMGKGTLGRVSRNLSINYLMIIHNCITVIRANENMVKQTYLFYRLRTAQKYLESMGLGSTGQTSLKKEAIKRIKILIPPKELQESFNSIVKPIWLKIGILKIQNQKLAQARDLLLPRLMSGKIDVSEFDEENIPVESEV
jgi:type I restriction enzyme, S subunit